MAADLAPILLPPRSRTDTPQIRPGNPEHLSNPYVRIRETTTETSNFELMTRASRPDLRSSRRSRRRQAVIACGGLSYFAAVFAGLFALVSLVIPVGEAPIVSLAVAGGLALAAAVLVALDACLAPRGDV